MTEPGQLPASVQTGGGAVVKNSVTTGGGAFVGRDQNIHLNFAELDLAKILELLRTLVPENDQAPAQLLAALKEFQYYHERLRDYKELHNGLNDVLMAYDQFAETLLDAAGGSAREVRKLATRWTGVVQRLEILLEWAREPQSIHKAVFSILEDGSLLGPRWAIDLQNARARLDELFRQPGASLELVSDAAYEFGSQAKLWMYQADKDLRETAGELYTLSRLVLGSLPNENV